MRKVYFFFAIYEHASEHPHNDPQETRNFSLFFLIFSCCLLTGDKMSHNKNIFQEENMKTRLLLRSFYNEKVIILYTFSNKYQHWIYWILNSTSIPIPI